MVKRIEGEVAKRLVYGEWRHIPKENSEVLKMFHEVLCSYIYHNEILEIEQGNELILSGITRLMSQWHQKEFI